MKKEEIVMIHGTDYVQMTLKLLEAIHLDEIIGDKTKRIALKPNLLLDDDASNGAITHPELVEGVLLYLKKHEFSNVKVMEGSWVGSRTSRAVKASGIASVCENYHVPFYDMQKDSSYPCDAAGMPLHLCSELKTTDFLINMPVLKGHCQTLITCALKNAKGVIPDSEKRRFHTMGLHKPIAHLNTVIPHGLILVDNICGDLNFEEGGNPVVMNRIFACLDPVLCDAYVCESIGYSVDDVPYIRIAERLNVGCADTSKAKVTMLNQPMNDQTNSHATGRVRKLEKYTDARDACSACYGSLIYALERLDDQGTTRGKREHVCIGQGWKDTAGEIGVGSCTKNCSRHLLGCPPKALDIIRFLEEYWQ